MTTLAQKQNLLYAQIQREVRNNPGISQRQVALRVRGRGFRGSNTLIRNLVRFEKAGGSGPAILRARAALTQGVIEKGGNPEVKQILDVIEAIQGKKIERKVRRTFPSIRVAWLVSVTVRISEFNGRKNSIQQFDVRGNIVQRLQDYSPSLVSQRVEASLAKTIDGQIAQFINAGGDKNRRSAASYLEGVSFTIINQSIPQYTVIG